jgi:hypothetical protein
MRDFCLLTRINNREKLLKAASVMIKREGESDEV